MTSQTIQVVKNAQMINIQGVTRVFHMTILWAVTALNRQHSVAALANSSANLRSHSQIASSLQCVITSSTLLRTKTWQRATQDSWSLAHLPLSSPPGRCSMISQSIDDQSLKKVNQPYLEQQESINHNHAEPNSAAMFSSNKQTVVPISVH